MTDLLTCLALGAVAVTLGPLLGARSPRRPGRLGLAAAALAPAATLCLFYSLAVHMHRSLGGWPRVIGDAGFPDALVLHADVAQRAFGSLLLGCLFVLPVALVLCLCVPRLRRGLLYLGVHAALSVACFGATQLAPGPFLSWWWD